MHNHQASIHRSHLVLFALQFAATLCLAFGVLPETVAAQPGNRGVRIATPQQVASLPNQSKRFALVIGVDKYADTQISTLGGATNDAKALAQALIDYAGFPADQVTLLASDQPAEREPTRGNILRRLSNLATVAPKDGLLLLSFAGHGIERGGQAFLLPADAQVSDDVDLLEQTAINVTHIKEKIRTSGIAQVLMLLDACRNDPTGRANADNPLTAAYTRGFNFDVRNREVTAFATLYATAVGRRAYEYKEKHQGYFTWTIVEGLKGAAANEKGEVTLAGLIKYLQERVPKKVAVDLGAGKDQRPFAVVEGYRADELVIAVPGRQAGQSESIADSRSVVESLKEPAGNERPRDTDSANGLEGTTWTGNSPESGEFTIQFLKDGKLSYSIKTGSVGGTWKQAGSFVQIVIANSYSVLEGNVEGKVMKLEGSNQEGLHWKNTLFLKAP